MHKQNYAISVLWIVMSLLTVNGQTSSELTIDEVIRSALQNNPELKSLQNEIDAMNAAKLQSTLIPNPEIEVEAENIFGNKDYSGFGNSEITVVLSQDIIISGKIGKQNKAASLNVSLAEWDYKIKRNEIITDIKKSYAQILVTQQLIEKNKHLLSISENLVENLTKKVKAGKTSSIEVSRAKIVANSLLIGIIRLESAYETGKAELAALMYVNTLDNNTFAGSIDTLVNIPDYDSLLISLSNNPKLKKYESEFSKQKAVINLEKAKAVPDIKVSAGVKRLNDINANTFLFGASVPLPFFNRNQGAIEESQIRYEQKEKEYESEKNHLKLQLSVLYNRFNTLTRTADYIKNESMSEAEEIFKMIKEGNLAGKFDMLDVLDAERTFFELQNEYLNIISEIQSIRIGIEGLTATELK